MTANIFNFRNVKVRLSSTDATTIYGVTSYNTATPSNTLPNGVLPSEVSAVVLTLQCSNITGSADTGTSPQTVLVTATITNSTITPVTPRILVFQYPVMENNAFDPLSGNLVLTANDVLQVQSSVANGVDVIISLLEVANATSA
jgi:hypothetical protein